MTELLTFSPHGPDAEGNSNENMILVHQRVIQNQLNNSPSQKVIIYGRIMCDSTVRYRERGLLLSFPDCTKHKSCHSSIGDVSCMALVRSNCRAPKKQSPTKGCAHVQTQKVCKKHSLPCVPRTSKADSGLASEFRWDRAIYTAYERMLKAHTCNRPFQRDKGGGPHALPTSQAQTADTPFNHDSTRCVYARRTGSKLHPIAKCIQPLTKVPWT